MVSKATCAPAWASRTARNRTGAEAPLNAGGLPTRAIVRTTRICIANKAKAPNCSGAFCSCEVHPPRERTSVLAAAFRSSHVIGAGTSVVWTRWSHRAAFVGTAMCARSCRHPFFMLRFLGRRSAGTDGSCTGRAGCGLGLSRRNERRAEQRRNDKRRDCKFRSHQNVSIGYTVTANPGRAIQFPNIAQISYSKKTGSRLLRRRSLLFQTSVTFRT